MAENNVEYVHNYYFLANSLPPLEIGKEPELDFFDFLHLLETNVYKSDLEKSEVIRRFYDMQNLRAFWLDEPHDQRGNLPHNELDEALLTGEGLPEYAQDFLQSYDGKENYLKAFSRLISEYFECEIQDSEGFLHDYLWFERDWRLVFCAFRAKKIGADLAFELRFEDPFDTLVAQLMAQKDAKTFEPPDGFEELKKIFEIDEPTELHKALCEYRMHKVDEIAEGDLFSFDFILSYMTKLILVEKWHQLDKAQGNQVIDTIIRKRS